MRTSLLALVSRAWPLAAAITLVAPRLHAGALPSLDAGRVAEIARDLPETAVNFTPPAVDRDYWNALAAGNDAGIAALQTAARRIAATEPPALTDALYDAFRKTGDRKSYEHPYARRLHRLGVLLYTTALTGSVEFMPALERELTAILDEPTWAVPAHTGSRPDRAAARDFVDLGAAARSASLATVDYLIGDRLTPKIRARLRDEIRGRIFAPYLHRVFAGDSGDFWWMESRNNWNAVCNTGVLLSALLLPDVAAEALQQADAPKDLAGAKPATAVFAAAYEACTRAYLGGFGSDGFCPEGIGYWSYGFGYYVLGSEWLRRATGGRVDLLGDPRIQPIATFPQRWEITPDVYPPFGDTGVTARPSGWLHDFVALRYGDPSGLRSERAPVGLDMLHGAGLSDLFCMTSFDLALPRADGGAKGPAAPETAAAGLRGWFPDGGALVVRRVPDPTVGLAAAFQGGHNGEPHNHDDLGSFILLCDDERVLSDLGSDTYVKDTFGPRRYTSDMINSRGHPVPIVAGQLQSTGAEARAVTVRTEFSDERDLWEIDLTSAYAAGAPALKRLTRTFVFTRSGGGAPRGRLEITDQVDFKQDAAPQAFGTALILQRGQTTTPLAGAPSGFQATARRGQGTVDVTWEAEADGESVALVRSDTPVIGIVPAQGGKGTRIGLDFPAPVHTAVIRTTFLPANP